MENRSSRPPFTDKWIIASKSSHNVTSRALARSLDARVSPPNWNPSRPSRLRVRFQHGG
ncbi:protein of unknown function [Methanoculleus bourgensis]|uniref:Uncharacterized protein n=1 Tax=Methanoculleus bourgensis TaxID=83986 RepID=A0A0X3BJ63_9EURY|nr:protein of unknown function [Methanoculleus bourgensis]